MFGDSFLFEHLCFWEFQFYGLSILACSRVLWRNGEKMGLGGTHWQILFCKCEAQTFPILVTSKDTVLPLLTQHTHWLHLLWPILEKARLREEATSPVVTLMLQAGGSKAPFSCSPLAMSWAEMTASAQLAQESLPHVYLVYLFESMHFLPFRRSSISCPLIRIYSFFIQWYEEGGKYSMDRRYKLGKFLCNWFAYHSICPLTHPSYIRKP